MESPDFANENNPPANIDNTTPEFILVGSQISSVNYVLVMDVSSSMLNKPELMQSKYIYIVFILARMLKNCQKFE